jgi:hypothetical protein
MRRIFVPSILLLTMMLTACNWEPGIDKSKFADLNRTVEEIKTFVTAGKGCDLPEAVTERLDAEIAIAKTRASSISERDLVTALSRLSMICKDGHLVCRSRTLLKEFKFVPAGRIYVPQELDPVIERYGFSTQRHLYRPTAQYWRSISTDSIRTIWDVAGQQIRNIENLEKYD